MKLLRLAPLAVPAVVFSAALSHLVDATGGDPASPSPGSIAKLAEHAREFLHALPDEQRAAATFDFDHDERMDWHFIPRDRHGLSLGAMDDAGRRAAHVLLRTALSAEGYLKAHTIMRLESVLYELESKPGRPAAHRDPQRYWFSVFGEPGAAPWGLRIEGHHLSLNLTVADEALSVTPFFLGANPGEVRAGPLAGLSVLAREAGLGRDLYRALNEAQRAQSVIAAEVPADVFLTPGRDDGFAEPQGVPASELDPQPRGILRALVETYLNNLQPELAGRWRGRLDESFDALHFAWIGSPAPGEAMYYRVTGPGFAIEYDNVQNGANHPHAVWRDFEGDFGRDLLAEHHREHHPR